MEMALQPARAWRVRFVPEAGAGESVLASIREPSNCVAAATAVDPAQAFAAAPGDGSLILVVSGAADAAFENEIDAVFAARAQGEPVFRGSVRSVRAVWSRALVFVGGAAEVEAEAIDAVLRFTLAARATFDLEAAMAANWQELERHSALSHAVTKSQQSQQGEVDAMTQKLVRMKMVHLRVQNAIEQLDPMLGANSRRLFAQLSSPALLADRMEMLEDPIQFGQDHYELANTRLIEGKYSSTELMLEVMIVVILVAELIAILWDKLFPIAA